MKLFDSELKIMELVWEREPVSAKELAKIAGEDIGWNKNTTYTIIKKLIEKNALSRQEPGFVCNALIRREDVQKTETLSLIDRLYKGSKKAFFASFIEEGLTAEDLEEIKKLIEKR